MKQPRQYRQLFAGVLSAEIPDNPAGQITYPDAAAIMQRVQDHVTEYRPHATHPEWSAGAIHALGLLHRLAGRTDAIALFEAGRLIQVINQAEPLVEGLRKIQKSAESAANAARQSRETRAATSARIEGIVRELHADGVRKNLIPARLLAGQNITISYSQVCRMLSKPPAK